MTEYLRIVYANLKERKLRSFLTLLGIIIGVIAIVLLYSFAQSMEDIAGEQFDKLGTNRIMIAPKGVSVASGGVSGSFGLLESDAHYLESIPGIDYVTFMLASNQEIEYGGKSAVASITGVDTTNLNKFFDSFDWDLTQGSRVSDGDESAFVYIGAKVEDLFDKDIYYKSQLVIGGRKFKVQGILEETGNYEDDYRIVIAVEQQRKLTEIEDGVTAIIVTAKDGVDIEEMSERIDRKLKRKKDSENFQVTTPTKLKEQSKQVMGVIKLIIVSIAMISLVVGGLGIMNSMYTAVLERTREIGVMKAIGSKNSDILNIFLLESSMLGLVGGIIGLLCSAVIIALANVVIAQIDVFSVVITMDPSVVALSIGFSLVVGIISGVFPAVQASKLKPVDALRYE